MEVWKENTQRSENENFIHFSLICCMSRTGDKFKCVQENVG